MATPDPSLPAKYRPADHEPHVRARWDAARVFHADPDRVLSGEKPPYSIFIPPPNVTARLHLGHALNNTLQDILARVHRMRGFEVLWMPGTDHAGIATQTVVEQRILKEEGKRRTDFTREEFIARVQAWKDEYEQAITNQLKAIGCSCDWERQRFTMDEICARAVREAFFILFRDGLIYRGKRLVNWDPVSQTALADDEVEMEEIDGFFYNLRYPLVHRIEGEDAQPASWSELARRGYPGAEQQPAEEQAWVTVATTRPETYLGDTAVAINPKDPRAVALEGLFCELPLVGRIIPVIKDDYVVMPSKDSEDPKARYATGFLKVTPAHDPNDYDIGRRHNLPVINVMAPDASISDKHGWTDIGDARLFLGLSREAARDKVVQEFKSRGLLEKQLPYRHAVGHSYRSHVPIEPYLSDQWYCKVTDDRLRGSALRAMNPDQRSAAALPNFGKSAPAFSESGSPSGGTGFQPARPESGDGTLIFFPERYARMYESWHENLRDWCISRQLWWGHRIPVWKGIGVSIGPDTPLAEDQTELERSVRHRVNGVEVISQKRYENDHLTEYVCVPPGHPDVDAHLNRIGLVQDPDVLDTWFSSALWPISTLGWPEPPQHMKGLLEVFNPSAVLCTAREIITLWVSRMVMFNRYFLGGESPGEGPVPFHHVYINPVVQDGHGQRMSKSLGNGVDPLDIVHSHGTDAMRLVLCQIATGTQDVKMPVDLSCPHCEHAFEPSWTTSPAGYKVASPNQTCPSCRKKMVSAYGVATGSVKPTADAPLARNSSSRFDAGRNFCTKLWNATRFAMMNLEGGTDMQSVTPSSLPLPDRWMLSRLARTIEQVNDALAEYQFSRYAELMYDLFWRDFCDWYLEAIKPTVKASPVQQAVLHRTLDSILRMLHPITPFITEVLHSALRPLSRGGVEGLTPADHELLCLAGWPRADPSLIDDEAEREFARLQSIVDHIRQVRSAKSVEPRRRVVLHTDAATAGAIAGWSGIVESLAGVERLTTDAAGPSDAPFLFEGRPCALSSLADASDPAQERQRLTEALSKLDKDISVIESRLNNPGYAAKAPPHLVAETRDSLLKKQAERDALREQLARLS